MHFVTQEPCYQDLWPFDLLLISERGLVKDYLYGKFGDCSFSRFGSIAFNNFLYFETLWP